MADSKGFKSHALESVMSELRPGFAGVIDAARRAAYPVNSKSVLGCAALLKDGLKTDGIFDAESDGVNFKCLFQGFPGSARLTATFCGADPEWKTGRTKPYFPRWSYAALCRENMLSIDDPMLWTWPHLRIGWYWGTPEKSWLECAASLVDRICGIKGVARKDLTLFSSSGGGTAAIYVSALLPGSLSISVNPQLYINRYHLAPLFERSTGYDLSAPDPFHRNSLADHLKAHPGSKHLICINARSPRDWEQQAVPFAKDFNADLRLGLNLLCSGEVLMWIYDCPGAPDAHTAFETRSVFLFIKALAEEFARRGKFDMHRWQIAALHVGEIWRELWEARAARNEMAEKLAALEKPRPTPKPKPKPAPAKAPFARIARSPKPASYFRYDDIGEGPAREAVFRCSSKDTDIFTAGLYSFRNKAVVDFRRFKVGEECVFPLPAPGPEEGTAFLIYAGVAGKTQNVALDVDSFEIRRRGAAR